MTPTPRAVAFLAFAALTALWLPRTAAVAAMTVVAAFTVADAWTVRRPPDVERRLPKVLARGATADLRVVPVTTHRVTVHQPAAPGILIEPAVAADRLDATVSATLRGRHVLGPVSLRVFGPLGLAAWYHRVGSPVEVHVYPDLPQAARIAADVRTGRFAEDGRHRRGPLGIGTELESIRDYQPDDDIRQVNWPATLRCGRPMSNQYRTEQDRSILCLVDLGRLMATPVGDATRLDLALDAAVAVAAVADAVGDRVGLVAFDDQVRRRVSPRRDGGRAFVDAVWDLQPSSVDADYELAFQIAAGSKRSLVVVFTDLFDEVAARPLVSAIGVLTRHHAVTVASVRDPAIDEALGRPPADVGDAVAAGVAAELEASARLAAARLTGAGAAVVSSAPDRLAGDVVGSYLRAKRRARL